MQCRSTARRDIKACSIIRDEKQDDCARLEKGNSRFRKVAQRRPRDRRSRGGAARSVEDRIHPTSAVKEAQAAILNETVIRLSPRAFEDFVRAIDAPPSPLSAKAAQRLRRSAPWKIGRAHV